MEPSPALTAQKLFQFTSLWPSWQATFETELQGYLAQLLEMDERNILVRARRKNAKVTWSFVGKGKKHVWRMMSWNEIRWCIGHYSIVFHVIIQYFIYKFIWFHIFFSESWVPHPHGLSLTSLQVSVHVSMHGMEKDAITRQQSLWDGRLRLGGTHETWMEYDDSITDPILKEFFSLDLWVLAFFFILDFVGVCFVLLKLSWTSAPQVYLI